MEISAAIVVLINGAVVSYNSSRSPLVISTLVRLAEDAPFSRERFRAVVSGGASMRRRRNHGTNLLCLSSNRSVAR